ncbi:acetyl/propionyl/methylcrotonyl-CoA carboxylase subunit alpha [Nesterenkonia alba]|uniref:acetyl/propionyl/methylcrotonyl-CoA carboxylase subunit alpha n=1 Tax=Nesterenkonia alba TaxID=515814 RepID=UPI0003B65198|nr:biotin carboxylase N-terminal domain-containing protein [Nesterenkonia alba]
MKRLLIANRGEIAVRIIRSAHVAGYQTVAVYADQDIAALHTELADTAVALEGSTPAETYLNAEKLIAAARTAGADAVHPGYGFLSENADFARAVMQAGMTWIGPPPEVITQLGNKVTARQIAVEAGAPLVPGSNGPVADAQAVRAFAAEHGLPVAIKAAHGGGGRGMRVARRSEDIEEAFTSAVREAEAAFGRGECFVERFLDRPRHVEAQVLADTHGNVVVVGTRDCSLQRRNQKLIEEAPAPFLTAEQQERIYTSARAIFTATGYTGAGTVEYLLSGDGLLSFLEVNTRLQVEHPVTEETTGVDLVAEQLRIAEGLPLSLTTDPLARGHAFEFRLNAEDPALGFLPTPGRIEQFRMPTGPGVRIDTGVHAGDEVAAAFDSMFAKLIVTGDTRDQALQRARSALAELRIEGIPTVLSFHRQAVESAAFIAAAGAESFTVHTRWIETDFAAELAASEHLASAVRHRDTAIRRTVVEIDGRVVQLGLPSALTSLFGTASSQAPVEPAPDAGTVTAPFSGTLISWQTEDDTVVETGTPVAVLETMKMESTVTAPRAGTFHRAEVEIGAAVERGATLGHIA